MSREVQLTKLTQEEIAFKDVFLKKIESVVNHAIKETNGQNALLTGATKQSGADNIKATSTPHRTENRERCTLI